MTTNAWFSKIYGFCYPKIYAQHEREKKKNSKKDFHKKFQRLVMKGTSKVERG